MYTSTSPNSVISLPSASARIMSFSSARAGPAGISSAQAAQRKITAETRDYYREVFGIELTEEEAETVFNNAKTYANGGELSEEMLEDVAGGGVVKSCINLLAYFAGAAWYELEPLFKKKNKKKK